MQHALFLAPHLNDVAFSSAGTMLRLLQHQWQVTMVTIFTASASHPQTTWTEAEKSLIGTIPDEMACRRMEDQAFARIMGLRDVRHWEFLEAKHRGYEKPAEAFQGIKAGDNVWQGIASQLDDTLEELNPNLIFAPQGSNNHADHLQAILALKASGNLSAKIWWYRDMPNALRYPEAPPSFLLPMNLQWQSVPLKEMDLERKILGCFAYASQIPCLYGPGSDLGQKLRAFHRSEALHLKPEHIERYAECFLSASQSKLPF
jgi:LmbE family N-acetylglucosaminyl deacetylase